MTSFLRKPSGLLLLTLVILAFGSVSSQAQNLNSYLWEHSFDLGFDSSEKWSHSFGVANRAVLSEHFDGEKVTDFENEHIELNHATSYKTGSNTAVTFGLRYRFRETFDDSRYDELRFVEQFNIKHANSSIGLGHRFRVEQRFRNVETIHRFRYQIGGSKALSEDFALGLSTEALLSLEKESKPSLEQRIMLELSNTSLEDIEFSLGLDYEMDDYNNELENQFYLITGVSFEL